MLAINEKEQLLRTSIVIEMKKMGWGGERVLFNYVLGLIVKRRPQSLFMCHGLLGL